MNKIIERQNRIIIISEAKTKGAITPRMVSEVLEGLNSDKLEKDLSNLSEGVVLKSDVLEVKEFGVYVNQNGYETIEETGDESGKSLLQYNSNPAFRIKLRVPNEVEQQVRVEKVEFFTTDNTERAYHSVSGSDVSITGHHVMSSDKYNTVFLSFGVSEQSMRFDSIVDWEDDTKAIVKVTLRDIEGKVYTDCLLSDEFMGVGKLRKIIISG